MIEDYSRLIDTMIDTCRLLGNRHIPEVQNEKINLISATRDDPRALPELILGPEDLLPTYAERRHTASEEESKRLREKLQAKLAKGDLSDDPDYDPYD